MNLEGTIITEKDLQKGNLKAKSVVIITKIGILHRDLIVRKIGTLKEPCFQKILKNVCKSIGCDKILCD